MLRYFVAAFLGALAGLILNAAMVISCAQYPELPRPDRYQVGVGPLAELQDQLMDRELALYVCKHLAWEGLDFAIRGAFGGALAMHAFMRLGDCWLRKSLVNKLIKALTCKYAVAMVCGFAAFSTAVISTNVRCVFLCFSCILSIYNCPSFILCGPLMLMTLDLMNKIRQRYLNTFELSIHLFCLFFVWTFLWRLWPDLINPVAFNTASIMGYNTREQFGVNQCGTINSSWIMLFFDSILILFSAYVILELSRVLLAKQVFEPLLRIYVRRPTFYLLTKVSILFALIMAVDINFTEVCARMFFPRTNHVMCAGWEEPAYKCDKAEERHFSSLQEYVTSSK